MSQFDGREPFKLGSSETARIEDAIRRGASRRELLRLLLAGGAGMATAGALLGRVERAHAQGTPRKGGRIKVAGSAVSAQDTVDPIKQSYSVDYMRCAMFYSGLTALDGSLTANPELAESFTSDKAKVWVFKIRKGVKFHDGKELTAADVVYSLNRHKDKAAGSRAAALAAQMEEIKASGPHEVTITLASPNADLPVILGTWHFLIIKEGTTDFRTAIGTGPYKVKEFTPGIRTIGVRNPDYWKPGKPHLDEIELIGIPDETARTNALISGDVQIIAGLNPRAIRQIEASPGFKVFETRAGYYTDLIMRKDVDPVKNPDFQLAIKYLQNRQEIRSAIFRNFAVVGNDQPIDPSNRYFCKDVAQRPYDPDKAKFHFAKTGIGNTPVQLFASTAAPGSIEMGVLLQEAAKGIGMNIDLQKVPAEGYWSNIWIKKPFAYGAINPRPSADILLTLFFKHEAAWNESGWKNDKFEQLLVAARAESDEAKRKQHYCDIQTIIRDEGGIGIPVFITLLDAHSAKVRGLSPIPLGNLMGNTFAEHVWLEA